MGKDGVRRIARGQRRKRQELQTRRGAKAKAKALIESQTLFGLS